MCSPSASPVSSSASHTGVYTRVVERHAVVRVRADERADEPEVLDPAGLVGRGRGILQRQCAGSLQPVGCRGAPLGDPVVVDPARPHRELGILDAAELQAEARVHHRDVDALGVEHLHPLVRVEAGRVQVFVVAAAAEVVEALARVAEAGKATFDDDAILDEARGRSRCPRSNAGGCPGRRDVREGLGSQRSAGSQRWPSASTIRSLVRDRFDRGFAHTSHHGFLPVEDQHGAG